MGTLAILASTALAPTPTAANGRVEIPIHQTMVGRSPRYSIPVSIGGQRPIDVMLDTGSVGLRVLRPRLSDDAKVSFTSTPVRYGYGSGVRIDGVLATTILRFGAAQTRSPIPIQIVTTLGCNDRRPRCPGSRLSLEDYGFGGNGRPGAGFPAILGVSLARLPAAQAGIVNPLRRVGDGRWIVEIPRPADDEPGRLILNPSDAEIAEFSMHRLAGRRGAAIEGCLLNDRTQRSFCGPALLDTGAVGVRAATFKVYRHLHWRRGIPGELVFGTDGEAQSSMSFESSMLGPASRVTLARPRSGAPPRLRPGVLPFYAFAVLYDPTSHRIGLRRRTDR